MIADDSTPYPEHARRDVNAAMEADYQRLLAHLVAKPRGPRMNLLRRLWAMWTGN
jgi:hypothetical protein